MRKIFLYSAGLFLLLGMGACQKDNFSAPSVTLSGHITYKGEPIGVQGNKNVYFELWQSGFGKLTPINVNVAQDGSYSTVLYNGTYRMDLPTGQGPYLPASGHYGDTTEIKLSGDQQLDIEVMPYYMIRDPKFTFSATDASITATFGLETIITDPALAKGIEKIFLLENGQQLADAQYNQQVVEVDGGSLTDLQHLSIKLTVPASQYKAGGYVFARIGVKISGVEDALYSQVEKINF